jgi:hypothetical protein
VTPAEKRYLVLESGVGAAIVNALLNGGVGWVIMRGLTELPIWGLPGVMFDLCATAGGVVFGTCLVVVLTTRAHVKSGKITIPEAPAALAPWFSKLPRPAFQRGVVLGALTVPIFVPPIALLFAVTGTTALAAGPFIALKAALAAVVAGLLTPFIVLAALLDLRVAEGADGARAAGS